MGKTKSLKEILEDFKRDIENLKLEDLELKEKLKKPKDTCPHCGGSNISVGHNGYSMGKACNDCLKQI